MASPIRRRQIVGGLAASCQDLSAAIRQCQHFNVAAVRRATERDTELARTNQDRFATRQKLRASESHFTVPPRRHDSGRTSSGRKMQQTFPESLAHKDAAVLSPTGPSEDGDPSQRDHGSAFDRDLADLASGKKA